MTAKCEDTSRDWLEKALELPVRFAQVREDPLLDLDVVRRGRPNGKILIIASGGCTVCALNTVSKVDEMVVVDPNPSQISLARLKLFIQRNVSAIERAALLGHSLMGPDLRLAKLTELAEYCEVELETLGSSVLVAANGLDFIGRYEMVFGEVARRLATDHDDIARLLQQSCLKNRTKSLKAMRDFVLRLQEILDSIMSLFNLVELFGEEATRNRKQSFSQHFFQRILWAITQLPTDTNHFLWQVLLNRSPPHVSVPWLSMDIPDRRPTVTFHEKSIQAYLEECSQRFDYIHLSNVLDWLSDEQARNLLQDVWNRLNSGGFTLIRQLNSNLNIPELNSQFEWMTQEAAIMLKRDRSFFYRDLHLARKP
ncbi:MAG: DUF3419 family protein [Gammaproteobacteria bacterium]|nr:DUF3419 family protein [Gammaproteobacteria bacterium]